MTIHSARNAAPAAEPLQPALHADHIGYVSRDEYEIQFADIFDQIIAHAAGAPINVVNPQVLRSTAQRSS